MKRLKQSFIISRCYSRLGVIMVLLLTVFLSNASAAIIQWYGPAAGPGGTNAWPTAWTAIPSMNSPVNSGIAGALDFVGDAQNPGFFMAQDAAFLFFRMRVDVATVAANGTTFTGAHLVLIDVVGWNYPVIGQEGKPDFSLAWDSKSNDPTNHGLEMQIPDTLGFKWKDIKMDDIDLNNAKKIAPPDINTTGQGFIRTVDSQPTINFGDTTFIDFAVAKSYLSANADLNHILTSELRIQLGSIANATDHNLLNADVAGGYTLDSDVVTSWGATVPEPSTAGLISVFFVCATFWNKRRPLSVSRVIAGDNRN